MKTQARRIADAVEEKRRGFMLGMLNRFRTESQIITERRLSGQMGNLPCQRPLDPPQGFPANSWFQRERFFVRRRGGAGYRRSRHRYHVVFDGLSEPVSVSGVAHRRLGNIQCKGVASWGSGSAAARPMDTEEAMTALIRFEAERA